MLNQNRLGSGSANCFSHPHFPVCYLKIHATAAAIEIKDKRRSQIKEKEQILGLIWSDTNLQLSLSMQKGTCLELTAIPLKLLRFNKEPKVIKVKFLRLVAYFFF